MTLTLTPEMEAALNAAAQERGATPEEIVLETLETRFKPKRPPTPEEHRARVYAIMGSSSHLGPSRLSEDKAEEIAREERRWK